MDDDDKIDGEEDSGSTDAEEEELPWIDWEELSGAPPLLPQRAFIHGVRCRRAMLSKGEFQGRIMEILKRSDPSLPELPPGLIDFLFDRAVDDHQQLAAWRSTVETLRGPEFQRTQEHLEQEILRYKKILGLLHEVKKYRRPWWMAAWASVHYKILYAHVRFILESLQGAKLSCDSLKPLCTLGRTDCANHLLELTKESIKNKIEGTPDSRKLTILTAAYAHAADLVPLQDNGHEDYESAVKMRISRARNSSKTIRLAVIGTWLMQRINGDVCPSGDYERCKTR